MSASTARPPHPPAARQGSSAGLRLGVTPESPSYKWWVAATIMLCVFMVMMNISTASLALPPIMTNLSLSLDEVQWVMNAYMIASAVVIPTVGWLGNVLGNRNLLLCGLALFVSGSVLCGLAWSGSALIAFRVLQGMGGGPLLPMAMTFVTQAFPPQRRGLAVGLYALGASFGPVVGPVLGGHLTEYIHWRMIFFVNLLPGLIAILLALAILPHTRETVRRRLDTPGLIALATFLVSLLLALSLGRHYGWDSAFIQRCLVIAGLSLAALVAIELSRKQPLIELRLLANPAFAAALVVVLVIFMSFYSNIFLQAFMLQRLFDYTPAQAGRFILPGALCLAVVVAAVGRLTDAVDRRVVILSGLVLFALACYGSSFLTLDRPASWVVWMIVARYFTLGLLYAPIVGASLSALPPEQVRMGSGLVTLVQSGLAPALALAAMTTVLQQRTTYYSGLLAQEQAASSLPWSDVVAPVRTLLHGAGETIATWTNGSLAMLQHHLIQQAALAAYQDYFVLMSLCLVVAPLILTLRARPPRPPAPDNRYDLVVIGSGPAGCQAALQACELGARVALLERREALGGAGLAPRLIPGKVLHEAAARMISARVLHEAAAHTTGAGQRPLSGEPAGGHEDMAPPHLAARVQAVAERQAALFDAQLQRYADRLDVFRGYHASLERPDAVHAWLLNNPFESLTLAAGRIVIATGSSPRRLPDLPVDNEVVFDTDGALAMTGRPGGEPSSAIVVGAETTGVEVASTLAALGAQVWLVGGEDEFLPLVDREIAAELGRHMADGGVEFVSGASDGGVTSVSGAAYERAGRTDGGDKARLVLADGRVLEADVLVVAAGREGASEVLGLEDVGVEVGAHGLVPVNELYQTSVPTIFAAGAVAAAPGGAPASGEQGRLAAAYALGRRPQSGRTPAVVLVHTIPEIAMLGATPQSLEADGIPYARGTARYADLAKAGLTGDDHGLLSLLFEPGSGRLLGVHIIGSQAHELIHVGQAVMGLNGTIAYFLDGTSGFPTLAEAYKTAAADGLRQLEA